MSPRKRCLPTLLALMVSGMRLFGTRAAEPCTVVIVLRAGRLSGPVPERNCTSESDTLELYRGEPFELMCHCGQFNAQDLLCMNYWLGSTLIESIDYNSYRSFNGTEQMPDVKEWQARNSSCSNIKPEVVQRQQGISDPYFYERFVESTREVTVLTVDTANLAPTAPSVMRFACEAYDPLTQVSVMSPPSCKVNIIANPCLSDPCLNGAQCLPRGGGYICVCHGDANIGKKCHRAQAKVACLSVRDLSDKVLVSSARCKMTANNSATVSSAGVQLVLRCEALGRVRVLREEAGETVQLTSFKKEMGAGPDEAAHTVATYKVTSPECDRTHVFRCNATSYGWEEDRVSLATVCSPGRTGMVLAASGSRQKTMQSSGVEFKMDHTGSYAVFLIPAYTLIFLAVGYCLFGGYHRSLDMCDEESTDTSVVDWVVRDVGSSLLAFDPAGSFDHPSPPDNTKPENVPYAGDRVSIEIKPKASNEGSAKVD